MEMRNVPISLLYHRQPRGDRMSEAPLAEAASPFRDYLIQEPA